MLSNWVGQFPKIFILEWKWGGGKCSGGNFSCDYFHEHCRFLHTWWVFFSNTAVSCRRLPITVTIVTHISHGRVATFNVTMPKFLLSFKQ